MDPILSFRALYKCYGTHQALQGVSGDLYAGEIVGLLGVNGAGKTTLSSILAGLHPATSGDLLFRGVSVYQNIPAYRLQVGYCAQRVQGIDALTVRQQLLFAGRCFGLAEAVLADAVAAVIAQCSLELVVDRFLSQLSGGYKQRFNIARSLLHNPQIIILDEPTVALDPHVRRGMWDLIQQLRELGKTIVLTTHYLDEAEYLTDRVCFLERGVVRAFDTPDLLLAKWGKARLEDIMLAMVEESI